MNQVFSHSPRCPSAAAWKTYATDRPSSNLIFFRHLVNCEGVGLVHILAMSCAEPASGSGKSGSMNHCRPDSPTCELYGAHRSHIELVGSLGHARFVVVVRFNDVASGPVPMPESYVKCEVPLMWWPLWGYNIGEYFQNSALGIAELVAAGVIDPTTVQLAPEVGGWPLRDFQTGMLKAFTDLPVRTTGQLAPRCPAKGVVKRKTEKASKCPPPRCYERMLVCRFRDVYEYQPPIAPWSAARAIVRSLRLPPRLPPRLLPLSGEEASSPTRFSVVFASRGHTQNGARLLTNEKGLIELCRRWIPPPACSEACAGEAKAASVVTPSASRGCLDVAAFGATWTWCRKPTCSSGLTARLWFTQSSCDEAVVWSRSGHTASKARGLINTTSPWHSVRTRRMPLCCRPGTAAYARLCLRPMCRHGMLVR